MVVKKATIATNVISQAKRKFTVIKGFEFRGNGDLNPPIHLTCEAG
jgi:hypothetical protein